jgi:nicotinamidase-related amidase
VPETALIVIDMLNAYDHEDADKLAASVRDVLPNIVELRDHARDAEDVLLVYANDNYDNWESAREQLIERALDGEFPDLVEAIAPRDSVAFIPKGRHSIFYETSLAHLLRVEDVKRVVLTGQVTEQCIFYSALDAYLRGHEVIVPPDAVAHIYDDLAEAALKMMECNLHAELMPAAEVFSYSRSSP